MNDVVFRSQIHKLLYQKFYGKLTSLEILVLSEDILTAIENRVKVLQQKQKPKPIFLKRL